MMAQHICKPRDFNCLILLKSPPRHGTCKLPDTTSDIVKLLLVGADVTMIAGVLYKKGPEVVSELISGLRAWLDEREYESVRQMKGSMCGRFAAYRSAYDRANYMEMLVNFSAPDFVRNSQ